MSTTESRNHGFSSRFTANTPGIDDPGLRSTAEHGGNAGSSWFTKWAGAAVLTASTLFAAEAVAGPLDIAVLTETSFPGHLDVEAKLEATGFFTSVDTFDVGASTPNALTLSNYGALLIFTSSSAGYADPVALGDIVADYYDAGGGVVCAPFEVAFNEPLQGRWLSGGYHAISRSASWTNSSISLGTYDAAHPIMQGVSSFTASWRLVPGVTLAPGAVTIASATDSAPFVAINQVGSKHVVDLGFWPFSSDGHFEGWVATTDGARLMANALLYATLGANVPPVAANDNYTVAEDQVLTVAASGLLANDSDADYDTLTVSCSTPPANGNLVINPDGSFTYTPSPNFSGTDTFTYCVNDGSVNSASNGTVTIVVSAVNDAPVAYNDAYTTPEDDPRVIDPRTNDTDADGDPLSTLIVNPPANGMLFARPDGSFRYEPNPNFFGVDSFTYQLSDGSDLSNIATVVINVTSVNDVPVANDDMYVTGEGQVLNVPAATGVRGNDTDVEDGTNGLVVIATSSPSFGTVVLNPNGSFTYAPTVAGYNGVDTFTYRAEDSEGATDVATVTINIGPLNSVPVAQDDVYAVDEDQVLTVSAANGVQKNDHDADADDVTTVGLVTNPIHGTLTINQAGGFEYTPNADYVGVDTFTYQIFDIYSMSNVATVTINIGDVNDLPIVNNDYYTVLEDGQLVIPAAGILANDTDVDGDALTAHLTPGVVIPPVPPFFISSTNHGSLELSPDGSFKYTPQPNFNGTDTFKYYASDASGNSSDATVTINVVSILDTPVAVDDSYTLNEDEPFDAGTMASVLANDTFEFSLGFIGGPIPVSDAGDATALSAVEPHSPIFSDSAISFVAVQDNVDHGLLELYDDPMMGALFGFFDYTPDPDFSGTDSFKYVILTLDPASGQIYTSNLATVTLNVNAVNDAPAANADFFSTVEDQAISVGAPGVLGNDTDTDNDAITAVLQKNPVNGTLSFNNNGAFVYTPDSNWAGVDQFTYYANDGTSASEVTTVTISVDAAVDTPVAVNDAYVVDEDTSLTLTAPNGILVNDQDPDGAGIQARLISGPAHGTLYLRNNGAIDYLAHPNYHGNDSFTYYVTNGSSNSEPATVSITVIPVEDAPVVSQNFYATAEDTVLNVAAPGVLADDFDADGDALTAVLQANAANGAVTLNADGSFTYSPNADFTGSDLFTYSATDGTTTSEVTTVTIVTGDANDAPVAVNDVYSTGTEDGILEIQAPGVLANDSDIDSAALMVSLVQMPQHGTVALNADGSFSYTPFNNYNGSDSFTYTVTDGQLESNVATVSVNTQPDNDGPVAGYDYYSTPEDTQLTIVAPGLLANDFDPEGGELTVVLDEAPWSGDVAVNPDGSFTYTPLPNFNSWFDGGDSFSYRVYDEEGAWELGEVYIDVTPVLDIPVANDDNYTLNEDTEFDSGFIGASVLANDSFETGGMFGGIEGPQGPSGPLASQSNLQPASDVTLNSVVIGPGMSLVAVQDNVDNGQLEIDPLTGFFEYTPNPDFSGTDTFTYVIGSMDFFGSPQLYVSNPATVTFNVTAINDAPVAAADILSTPEDTTLNVAAPGVLVNDTDADGDSLTAVLNDNPYNGIVTLNGNGSLSYTPNANFNGADTFTYVASDGSSASLVTTVTVNVTPVNDLPVAADDLFVTDEDTTLTVVLPGVLQNDTDADDSVLTASLASAPLNGTVQLGQLGDLTYVPNPNFFGVDTFSYRANDGKGNSNVATVSITVNPVNDAPVGNEDNYGTFEDVTLTINAPGVLADDVDVDGDMLSVSLVSAAQHGIVTLNADGGFVYDPNSGFSGVDQFFYQAHDGLLSSEVTTVTITIGAVNDPPVANDDTYFVYEDTITTVPAPGILANDFDAEDDVLTASLIAGPFHGTLTLETSGSFVYTPNANFTGEDFFTYQANDGVSDSNVATVTINVEELNDAPLANEDYYSTDEEQPITVAAPGVLGNDFDNEGGPLVSLLRDNPLNGVVSMNGDGSFTYTPDAGFFGEDVFTYNANDGFSNSLYTTVTILVRPKNDAPVAVNDQYIADEDTTLTVLAPGVLQNDSDEDDDALSATLVVQPLNGTVVLSEDGSFEYLAYPNFIGTDSFIYQATDGLLNSAPATVTITVRNAPDAPVANPDNYGTQENTALSINAPGVLADDYDLDGDPLTAIVVNNPLNGVVNLQPDGGFIYTPNNGFNGEDYFTYVANDGTVNSEVTTVTITVGAVNDSPVANNDLFNVFEDQATTINAPGVLANDTDSDDSSLSATLISGPLYGTLTLNEDGSFTYEPFANFNGEDSFTYQATDGVADSNVATVLLNVVPVDDAPLTNEDYYVVDEDQSINVAAPGILGNDSDSDGSVLTALLEEEPPHGILSLNGDGSFTYTPDAGFVGEDFFIYRANDGVSNSVATTVTIIVRPRNDRPTALSDTYVVAEDSVLNQATPGVLANDTDEDDGALSATLEIAPLHGTVTLNADGSFVYTPNPNFNGTDSFTYRADDGVEASNPATVTITVTPVQDVPVANNDNYSTTEETQLTVAAPGVLGDDVDVDGDTLTALLVDSAANGTVALNGDGSFTYTPNPGFSGADTFTYEATDGTDVSNIATVTIGVGAVNDVPVANPDTYSLFEDTVSNVAAPGVLQNDTDGDDDTLSAVLITGPLNGTVVLNADGSFTYTPFANFNGVDTFTYQVNDGLADSNVTTVSLNVVPQSDVPLANLDYYSTTEELPLVVDTPGVLGNDFDADGETLVALLEDNPLNGVVALSGSGSFTYTPNPGFFGTDLFTYRAHDGTQNSEKTTVTITVHPRNDVPKSSDDVYNGVEDTPLSIPVANGVLANDDDLDGDSLTAVLVNQPLNGSVALNGDGSFTYTPNLNFNGQDYFTYRAYDGQKYSDPVSKVTINVAPVQDVPVAVNDLYSVPEDKSLTVVAPGVLGNDSDADKEVLSAFLVDSPQHGIITFNANGSFNYTPDEDFFGSDTFTYYANDGTQNSSLATVTINVGGRNDGPVAVDDTYVVLEDAVLNIAAPGVLGNDTDDDGDTLQTALVTPPLQGTVVLNSDGSFTYTPNLGYSGADQFVYRANDGSTLSNTATVRITVSQVNDAPVLSNVVVTTPLNENANAMLAADLFDQDVTDTFLVTVNWGDGTMPTVVTYPAGTSRIFLTHQYLDDNPTGTPSDSNAVTITVQDNNGGSDTENRNVVVNNVAPNFENVTITSEIPTGGIARLKGTITDVGTQDTFVLTVNWGDGTVEVTNHGPGTSPFDYMHVYPTPGNYPVTVTVQDDDGGIRTINRSVTVRNTVDLILSMTANPDPASVGELLTYTMIITNNGPDTAHDVVLMDTLPTNVEVTSSTPTAVPVDGVLHWFLGDMAPGQTLRVDLIVKTLQQGPITNFGTVISDDLDPNNANNAAAVTTTIGWLPDGPDLMADAVTVDTVIKVTKKGTKCKVKLWALVANRGTQEANSSIYSVYISDDAIFAPHQDMKLKTKRFSKMKPGQVKAQKQTIKLPTDYLTTGKFLIVQLDDGNLVFEGNETNNLIIYGPLP